MKLLGVYSVIAIGLAAAVAAVPAAEANANPNDVFNVLEARKGCSGSRKNSDKCGGNRLGPQNSFHNWYVDFSAAMTILAAQRLTAPALPNFSKGRSGKCCAKNKNGSGGLDVNKGQGREDCGFCFSGKCSG
ncbi:hypothetical protein LEL_01982 [Akanthomyces lecanii RCEF 1005]|uniref:Uncharacterized protein n=1 Tax=Akanthomyces lecanii RCEF 1005 TaxID=1081108 RepID=A0A168KY42_CORDF|nr:hypothetical protein LEL_01982 [Akanthomyces lecanii RCEF 1005]